MSRDEKAGFRSRLWSAASDDVLDHEEKVVPLSQVSGPQGRNYEAFATRANVGRLRIQCATRSAHYPSYNYLLNIVYEHAHASMFILIYSFMKVEVKGRQLGGIVHAINAGSCDSIHEYHKNLYDKPAEGVPLIESISVTIAGDDEAE